MSNAMKDATGGILLVVACLAFCPRIEAQGVFGALKKIDPTNGNSEIVKFTGHKLDPGVLLPHLPPPPTSRIDDPIVERVETSIDPRTGDVYESSRSHPRHRIGIVAHIEVHNGQRYWTYHGKHVAVPNDVDDRGRPIRFAGTNIYVENDTPRRLVFKMAFEPAENPQSVSTFNDLHTLDPGTKGLWHLGPQHGINSFVTNNARLYRVRIEAFDPNSGEKIDEWGPRPDRIGLVAVQGQQMVPENNVTYQSKTLVFRVRP